MGCGARTAVHARLTSSSAIAGAPPRLCVPFCDGIDQVGYFLSAARSSRCCVPSSLDLAASRFHSAVNAVTNSLTRSGRMSCLARPSRLGLELRPADCTLCFRKFPAVPRGNRDNPVPDGGEQADHNTTTTSAGQQKTRTAALPERANRVGPVVDPLASFRRLIVPGP